MGFIALVSNQKPNTKNRPTKDDAQSSRKLNPGISDEAVSKGDGAYDEKHKAAERGYWRRQNQIITWGLIFNILTFIGAIVGVCIAYSAFQEARRSVDESKRQADAAIKQIKVAEDAMRSTNRAWVSLTTATPIKLLKPVKANEPIKFEINFGNTGQTPANNAATKWNIDERIPAVSDWASVKGGPNPICVEPKKLVMRDIGRRTLYPGATYSEKIETTVADQDIEDGETIQLFKGCFAYEAAGYETPRQSGFCFYLKPGDWEFRPCADGNLAD